MNDPTYPGVLSIRAVVYEEDEQSVEETARKSRDTLEQGKVDQWAAPQNSASLHHPKRNCHLLETEIYNDKDETL